MRMELRNPVAINVVFEVLRLSMEDLPYEECIPDTKELHLLKKNVPSV